MPPRTQEPRTMSDPYASDTDVADTAWLDA